MNATLNAAIGTERQYRLIQDAAEHRRALTNRPEKVKRSRRR
jgi:hypothetical protein